MLNLVKTQLRGLLKNIKCHDLIKNPGAYFFARIFFFSGGRPIAVLVNKVVQHDAASQGNALEGDAMGCSE